MHGRDRRFHLTHCSSPPLSLSSFLSPLSLSPPPLPFPSCLPSRSISSSSLSFSSSSSPSSGTPRSQTPFACCDREICASPTLSRCRLPIIIIIPLLNRPSAICSLTRRRDIQYRRERLRRFHSARELGAISLSFSFSLCFASSCLFNEEDVTTEQRKRDYRRRAKFLEGKSEARIYRASACCVAGRYSKALLNYLAASNLPEPTYTRHAARLADVTSRLRSMPKSKSPLTGGQAA